ncbi:MAG: serine protease [Candidatus Carbobacillus altaicus]|nr:serine protease [Candidatus Carbobacillus altaicus]
MLEKEWGVTGRPNVPRWRRLALYGVIAFLVLLSGFIGFRLAFLFMGTKGDKTSQPASVPLSTSEQIIQTVSDIDGIVVGVSAYHHKDVKDVSIEDDGSSGSAVIYAKKKGMAYLVTNNHVIDGAERIEVNFPEENVAAELVGADPYTDLAVLRIPARYVEKVATLGTSSTLRRGEMVIVSGNSLGLYSNTITVGYISSLHQKLPIYFSDQTEPDWEIDVLQIDAAVNYGNSGGGLFNLRGEVVGINSAKVIEPGVENIGFSIPIDLVKGIISELENFGKVKRPYLGIVVSGLSYIAEDVYRSLLLPASVYQGVLIREPPDGPAKAAGLLERDVIVAIDHQPVTDKISLRRVLYQKSPGDTVTITFYRRGQTKEVQAVLGETP